MVASDWRQRPYTGIVDDGAGPASMDPADIDPGGIDPWDQDAGAVQDQGRPERLRENAYWMRWPAEWRLPVVLSVPHSGNAYPESFWEQAVAGANVAALEDPYLDRLLPDTASLGLPVLAARFGRAYVDVNRSPAEWDQAMFGEPLPKRLASHSGRVKAGLGTFPRFLPPREPINRRRLTLAEGVRRWMVGYRPYHRTLAQMLSQCRARFGWALLVDLHSMPQLPGERLPDLVVGDSFGRACSMSVSQTAMRAVEGLGLSAARNYPYAGGFITQRFGVPAHGLHAIQLEFARPLYMDERSRELLPARSYVTEAIAAIVEQLGRIDPALLQPAPAALAGED